MPVVTISLCEKGYEGYTSITKGQRSQIVNKMLKDYALKRSVRYVFDNGPQRPPYHLTAHEVWTKQERLEQLINDLYEENTRLKQEMIE